MSSIQERLHLKRVPLDTWNIQEQLCLASAVVRSGDQNWMSVSRALKTIGEPNRPSDWYSQKRFDFSLQIYIYNKKLLSRNCNVIITNTIVVIENLNR